MNMTEKTSVLSNNTKINFGIQQNLADNYIRGYLVYNIGVNIEIQFFLSS